jgi:hypothetical protein
VVYQLKLALLLLVAPKVTPVTAPDVAQKYASIGVTGAVDVMVVVLDCVPQPGTATSTL